MFDEREKLVLLIDGANLYATSKALGFDIDYKQLLKTFQSRGYLLRAYYYTAIELAIDAMELASTVDHFVLFSGDGDFRKLVEVLQRKGKKVTVVSTTKSQPPMIADELRRQADFYLDIQSLQTEVGRDEPDGDEDES